MARKSFQCCATQLAETPQLLATEQRIVFHQHSPCDSPEVSLGGLCQLYTSRKTGFLPSVISVKLIPQDYHYEDYYYHHHHSQHYTIESDSSLIKKWLLPLLGLLSLLFNNNHHLIIAILSPFEHHYDYGATIPGLVFSAGSPPPPFSAFPPPDEKPSWRSRSWEVDQRFNSHVGVLINTNTFWYLTGNTFFHLLINGNRLFCLESKSDFQSPEHQSSLLISWLGGLTNHMFYFLD